MTEGQCSNGSKEGIPLYLHTLETLCKELISGRGVIIDDGGNKFRLASPESRSILNWYWKNRKKWNQRNQKDDVEEIVNEVVKDPPVFAIPQLGETKKGIRKVYLKSLRAHRFGGIHRYGTPENPPKDFELKFNRGLTVIEGENGAGKTSLMNAICWCMTGFIYRTQRQPEEASQEVLVRIGEEDTEDEVESTGHNISAITPIPPADVLKLLGDKCVPLDTSVELTFEDDEGNEIGQIKRTLRRTERGKIMVDEPDFMVLGLDPIAREIGTKMPGLIPYIQLGNPCDIGTAVARLTGIKPLEDLVRHASKSKDKLKGEMVKDREARIEVEDREFLRTREELTGLLGNHPEIKPKGDLPQPSSDKKVEEALQELKAHFQTRQGKMLENAKKFLGDSFDYSNAEQREDLIENVGTAKGLVQPSQLRQLPSAKRLSDLGKLDQESLLIAEGLISRLVNEAKEIYELSLRPDVAGRIRLYTRIANWIKEHYPDNRVVQSCPVCLTDLEGKVDQITGKSVKEHIREAIERESEHIEKTLAGWERAGVGLLKSELPDALSSEIGKILPRQPKDLIYSALVEELFESPIFKKSLAPMKKTAQDLSEKALGSLGDFKEPAKNELPSYFGDGRDRIRTAIDGVERAVAFARWRKENEAKCKEVLTKIIGVVGEDVEKPTRTETDIENLPLRECLVELDGLVRGAEPLTDAVSKVEKMEGRLSNRRKHEDRIALYARAAREIDKLLGLRELVKRQVKLLIGRLSDRTKCWEDYFYKAPFTDAPKVVKTDVESNGSLSFEVKMQGTSADAHHITNTSHLRATLFAFLIAFWEHLWVARGGLALVLFDDLPELFDRHNRHRIASNIHRLVESGGQIIVTTNDHNFRRDATQRVEEMVGPDKVQRRYIHPLAQSREHIELGYFVEEIEEKERAFRENKDEPRVAREYIRYLRIYLENRLLDLFDVSGPRLPLKPTLAALIEGLRSRVHSGIEPFTGPVYADLVNDPALKGGSTFRELMNKSHHGREDEVAYTDVSGAQEECRRMRKLVTDAWEAYERWLRRDVEKDVEEKSINVLGTPNAMVAPPFRAPIIENLAAFTSEVSPGEPLEGYELINGQDLLQNHAVYLINTHNFGFAGRIYCRAIVKLSEESVADNSLVIALYKDKVYARRVWIDEAKRGMVTLGSDAENPMKRPPSLFLPSNEVKLLQVVGIVFGDEKALRKTSEEAVEVDEWGDLEKVELVFRDVRGESAIPFALPGQMILGGRQLEASDLEEHKGYLVAIATSGASGGAALKRIGERVDGAPHIRQFESIGGLGESMLVRIEDVGNVLGNLPLLVSARLVLGVLYEV